MVRSLIWLTNLIVGVVTGLLGARLLMRLFGANPASDFVSWIYATTEPLLAPFTGAFPARAVEPGFVLEFTTLFAILVYSFAAYLITELLRYIAVNTDKFHKSQVSEEADKVEHVETVHEDRHIHHHV